MKIIKIILIILIICWMATVFVFSSQKGEKSGGTSGKVINKLFKIVKKSPTEEQISKLQLPIRKLAHFTIYLIGGVLAILLLKQYNNITTAKKIIYCQLFITLYALSDEFHQYFIPGRTASIIDVLIDSVGGLVGIIILALI